MLFAELLDVLERHSGLVAIGVVLLLFLLVPPFRRSIINAYREGQKDGEKWKKKWSGEKEEEENTQEEDRRTK